MAQPVATPRAPRLFGDLVLLSFLFAQLADGGLTYVGLHVFGLDIEANPLIRWHVALWGPGVAVVGAKLFATACGSVLHFYQMHRTVGVLTVFYLLVAVWPWTLIMWP